MLQIYPMRKVVGVITFITFAAFATHVEGYFLVTNYDLYFVALKMCENFKYSYHEVVPNQTITENYREITLNTGNVHIHNIDK